MRNEKDIKETIENTSLVPSASLDALPEQMIAYILLSFLEPKHLLRFGSTAKKYDKLTDLIWPQLLVKEAKKYGAPLAVQDLMAYRDEEQSTKMFYKKHRLLSFLDYYSVDNTLGYYPNPLFNRIKEDKACVQAILQQSTVEQVSIDQALIKAVKEGFLLSTKLLLDMGANIHQRLHNNDTLLHTAIFSGFPKLLTMLQKGGLQVDAKNAAGETPLHVIALAIPPESIDHCKGAVYSIAVTRKLLSHHAAIDAQDMKGNTPLHYAVLRLNTKLVGYLLSQGADINQQNLAGETALHIFAKVNPSMVITGTRGGSGRIYADIDGTFSILLKSQPDVRILNKKQKSAWQVIAKQCQNNRWSYDNHISYWDRDTQKQILRKLHTYKNNTVSQLLTKERTYRQPG
jgi:Ankyrin repeats (3 copies)